MGVRTHPSDKDSCPDAFERLVDEHGSMLYQLGLRFCGDSSDAEDMVQETFINAYKGWDGFRGESDPKTWLYTIAARVCARMGRKRSGEPDRIGSLDELLPFGEERIAMVPGELGDELERRVRDEARQRVEGAIASLPDTFRVPLVLKEIVGFGVADVARILGLSEGTVRSRVHRARLKLRAAVDTLVPRAPGVAPPPAYPERTCLDLLDAKQEAIDRGVPFDTGVICDRCRSVFATLDLAHEACRDLRNGVLPRDLRERILTDLGGSGV